MRRRLILAALIVPSLILGACGADAASASITSLSADASAGKTLYTANCASCHGSDAASGSANKNVANEVQSSSSAAVNTILAGDGQMPSFASTLSDQEIADIVAYIKTL